MTARSCIPTGFAARPPTICGPDAYPAARSRCFRAARRPRCRRRRVLLRRVQEGPDRRGREGQRRPDRRDDARRRRRRSSPRRCWPRSTVPVKVRYQDRTFTLTQKAAAIGIDIRGSVDKALKRSPEGDMFTRTLAQRARRVARHRARGRGQLQPARDPQARQARPEVDRPQAGRRQGGPVEGQGRADGVPDRPARQVQLAGQGGRADAARPGQHRVGAGQDDGRQAEGLDRSSSPRSIRRS